MAAVRQRSATTRRGPRCGGVFRGASRCWFVVDRELFKYLLKTRANVGAYVLWFSKLLPRMACTDPTNRQRAVAERPERPIPLVNNPTWPQADRGNASRATKAGSIRDAVPWGLILRCACDVENGTCCESGVVHHRVVPLGYQRWAVRPGDQPRGLRVPEPGWRGSPVRRSPIAD